MNIMYMLSIYNYVHMLTHIWRRVYDIQLYDLCIWFCVYDYTHMNSYVICMHMIRSYDYFSYDLHIYDSGYMIIKHMMVIYGLRYMITHISVCIWFTCIWLLYMIILHMTCTYMILFLYDFIHMTHIIWLASIWSCYSIIYVKAYIRS